MAKEVGFEGRWTISFRQRIALESSRGTRVHHFSMTKVEPGREIEMIITVKEFFTPKDPALLFFVEADKQTNQNVAPFTPCGWGKTLMEALEECVRAVNRFPYQG
jgi:hypothetical protein